MNGANQSSKSAKVGQEAKAQRSIQNNETSSGGQEVEILPALGDVTRGDESAVAAVENSIARRVLPGMGEAVGSYHLLSIGIDQYLDWPRLNTAVNGAVSVASTLTNQYAFFEPGNVRLLLDNEATEGNILAELRDLANKDRVQPEDSVVIYYAGHGHLDDLTDEGSWIPWESDTRNPESWISNARIKTIIAAMPARHVFLVSDSCFSGDFFRGKRNRGIEIIKNEQVRDEYLLRSRTAITSGALEPVADGGADGQSVFTYFFLKALRQIREPYVMTHEIFDRVRRGVEANADQRPQSGMLSGTNGEQGLFVLFRKGDAIIDQQLVEMRERNNRLEAQMLRVEQERAENIRRQEEKEAELARLQAEIEEKSNQMANLGTGAAGSDAFAELAAYYTQLNTVRANQAEQLKKLKERQKRLEEEQARIEEEKRQKELAVTKASFESDYQVFTNLLVNPFTKADAKVALWKAIAQKYDIESEILDEFGNEVGELEWDGMRVALTQASEDLLEQKREAEKERLEQEKLEREAAQFRKDLIARLDSRLSFAVPGLEIEMIWVEPGSFLMGSPEDEPGRKGDEKQHRVTLTQGYWLGKFEVTREQYYKLKRDRAYNLKATEKRLPAANLAWESAREFIDTLNENERTAGRLPEGYEYGLPTEAQWEFACRAGTKTAFSFGATLTIEQANFNGKTSYSFSDKNNKKDDELTVVGSYPANAWGFHDMHGNVAEWCEDTYIDYPANPVTDPFGVGDYQFPVIRGGSFEQYANSCRSASRNSNGTTFYYKSFGFRLCLRPVRK